MMKVFSSHMPVLVLLMYLVFKVWESLPITLKEDLPELEFDNIVFGGIILTLAYYTFWLWACPMDRIREVRQTYPTNILSMCPSTFRLRMLATDT